MNIFKKKIILIFVFLVFGCSHLNDNNNSTRSGLFYKTIVVDNTERRYAIYIPPNSDNSSHPLIMELHGGGIYIEDMTGDSGYKSPYKLWMDIAKKENLIIVFPEGLNGTYGKPTWNDCRANSTVSSKADDVKFIKELIRTVSSNYEIDKNRIYVSGTSNGGLMALRLAIELSGEITAVASIASSMPDKSKCGKPVKPISILFMNGTDDNHLPYTGGTISNPPKPSFGSVSSVEASINMWISVNKTDTIPTVYTFPDIDKNDGGNVIKYSYSNGENGTEVVLYKINGGGHSAPSIEEQYSSLFEKYFNKQNHDIEMTTEVWKFFKNKKLK